MSAEAGRAIVAATVALLGERGVDGFTLRDVVERAGVSTATIYRRWPSKADLVAETLIQLMRQTAGRPVAGSPTETIRVVVRNLVHLLSHTPVGPALPGIIVEASRNPAVEAAFQRWFSSRRELLGSALAEGVASGLFRADMDVDAAFDLLAGPPYYRMYFTRQPLTEEYAVRHAEEFIRSVLARPAPSTGG